MLLVAALFPGAARADALPIWQKFRPTLVTIDNAGDYPEHAFYLVGVAGNDLDRPDKPWRVHPGEPVHLGRSSRWLYRIALVAVPRGRVEREGDPTWAAVEDGAPGVRRSTPVDLHPLGPASVFDPTDYQVTHFRIELSGERFTLVPGPVELHSHGADSWAPALLLTAAVLAIGFWGARKLRSALRPAPRGAEPPRSAHDAR